MLRVHRILIFSYRLYVTVSLAYQYRHNIDSSIYPVRGHVDMRVTLNTRLVFIPRRALFVEVNLSPALSKSSLRKLVKANFSDPSRCPSPKGWSGKPGERTAYESIQQWSYAAVRELGTAQNAKSPSPHPAPPLLPGYTPFREWWAPCIIRPYTSSPIYTRGA